MAGFTSSGVDEMFSSQLLTKVSYALSRCRTSGISIVTAESCTGGLIASCLTEVPGASNTFIQGYVVYSNEAKSRLLGVSNFLIKQHGAVSEQVARAMAEGALLQSPASLSNSCTGIAGPSSDSSTKPIGRVHICCALRNGESEHLKSDYGNIGRSEIRLAAVADAIRLIITATDSL